MTDPARIVNENGQWRSCNGADAVNALRLRTIIQGLKFKQRTGMELTRAFKIVKVAQQTTGLKTRNIDTLIAALETMFNAQLDTVEVSHLDTRGAK